MRNNYYFALDEYLIIDSGIDFYQLYFLVRHCEKNERGGIK
ncbi:MAG: hypothetical protein N3D17_00790 [bacterium]|nr:hypothetical protein [bacterium]